MTTVFVCRIIRAAFFCVMFCCSTTHARIGETSVQFADRYGAPKDTPNAKENDTRSPLVQGAIHHRYDYQGWSIRAAFLQVNGPAIRMEYQKIDGAPPTDSDRQAIVAGNSGNGMSWKEISLSGYDDKTKAYFAGAVGGKIWRRSDGAVLWLRSPTILRLELPVARDRDEARNKAKKEEKARTPAPKF